MTDTTHAWPFTDYDGQADDADRNDPLTALRIPVTGSHPRFYYLAALDRDSEARPTYAEAAILASYIEYVRSGGWLYTGSAEAEMLEKPLDAIARHNTVVFHKYAEGDWSYRRISWRDGPLFVPTPPFPGYIERTEGPFTLGELLDRRVCTFIPDDAPSRHWVEWKAARPDVFRPA
ncbi:hypothetical protein ABN028_19575 [Actinopolymorpha sp. B17G11]|uniref:hypothetical protein n=1 Tax=Actinopolymorpha sp. B17G11 TaxID=3160861 RepID=UPI0032E465BB